MRQAGRYQKTFRALRDKHSFIELCKKPELSSLVGLNAVQEFDFDVAILFSDLLFPLEAFGMGLDYKPGPVLGWQLSSQEDFKKFASTEEAFEKMKAEGQGVGHIFKEIFTNIKDMPKVMRQLSVVQFFKPIFFLLFK